MTASEQPVGARVAAVLRSVPFTAAVVVVMVVLGVLTRALWEPVNASAWWDRLAYGLPAFEAGRWWTVVTGALLATEPLQYVPVLGGFAVMVGFCERRVGTPVAALAAVGGQAVGVLGAAGVLAVGTSYGWAWATRLGEGLDVGFSAGAVCALTVVAFALDRPWRGRVLFGVWLYVVANLLLVGVLWDVEHAFGATFGVLVGRALVRPHHPLSTPRPSEGSRRTLAVAVLVGLSVAELVLLLLPTDGPLGPDPLAGVPPAAVVALVVGQLLVAASVVLRGRRSGR